MFSSSRCFTGESRTSVTRNSGPDARSNGCSPAARISASIACGPASSARSRCSTRKPEASRLRCVAATRLRSSRTRCAGSRGDRPAGRTHGRGAPCRRRRPAAARPPCCTWTDPHRGWRARSASVRGTPRRTVARPAPDERVVVGGAVGGMAASFRASARGVGAWKMSATVTSRFSSRRIRLTSWIALRLWPPCSKKSASTPFGRRPSTSAKRRSRAASTGVRGSAGTPSGTDAASGAAARRG